MVGCDHKTVAAARARLAKSLPDMSLPSPPSPRWGILRPTDVVRHPTVAVACTNAEARAKRSSVSLAAWNLSPPPHLTCGRANREERNSTAFPANPRHPAGTAEIMVIPPQPADCGLTREHSQSRRLRRHSPSYGRRPVILVPA